MSVAQPDTATFQTLSGEKLFAAQERLAAALVRGPSLWPAVKRSGITPAHFPPRVRIAVRVAVERPARIGEIVSKIEHGPGCDELRRLHRLGVVMSDGHALGLARQILLSVHANAMQQTPAHHGVVDLADRARDELDNEPSDPEWHHGHHDAERHQHSGHDQEPSHHAEQNSPHRQHAGADRPQEQSKEQESLSKAATKPERGRRSRMAPQESDPDREEQAFETEEDTPDPSPAASPDHNKPRLLIENHSPDRSVAALRDILSSAGEFFDRGVPVRLVFDQVQHGTVAQMMTADSLVLMAHRICRPYALKDGNNGEKYVRLPRPFATMYLEWRGEWRLPPFNGIASSPLLHDDGTICSSQGYDRASGMWVENVPDLTGLIPVHPSKSQAMAAQTLVRETFKTFCYADAETLETGGIRVVDTSRPPGKDESAFLVALLTAACRPSLHLAPGVLMRAPSLSGAGAGKGLLARCICIIAFGREPHAVTAGATPEELEKRIASELIQGSPSLFLDNLNNTAVKSDLLASAITERPARVRLLGTSQMVQLNASSFVILTGNGLRVSEDLARRFIPIEFDARTEDPEARPFTSDIRLEVTKRRAELLAALLTIWRWGRLSTEIKAGRALGSFGQWCSWVRDPLLALGCQDPADRVSEAKERDTLRQSTAEIFSKWWEVHRDQPTTASNLHEEVTNLIDPQGRGRQFVTSRLERLAGTRLVGFVLNRQAPAGKWGAATYALQRTEDEVGDEGHGGHRDHRAASGNGPHDTNGVAQSAGGMATPMPPMPPMPSATPMQSPKWRARL
jgi:hypothetical protein